MARKRGAASPGIKSGSGGSSWLWSSYSFTEDLSDLLAMKGKALPANGAWECAAGRLGDLSVIPEQPHGVSGVCPTNPLRATSDRRKDEPGEVCT